jgi:ketosteroid isomerase-like protein
MELADRFFAAIQAGDVAAVRDFYDPAALVWHNNDRAEQAVDQNLVVLSWCMANIGRMRYEDVRRQPTPTGFVQQHVLRGTAPSGVELDVPACLVVAVAGGRVMRIDEYLDSAHILALTSP